MMRIVARYSHLNGEEYLLVHRPTLWQEVQSVIREVDAESCRTKKSEERRQEGRLLYSPRDMNRAFKTGLENRKWSERRKNFYVTSDEKLMRNTHGNRRKTRRKRSREPGTNQSCHITKPIS